MSDEKLKLVKVNETDYVNPKHVLAVHFDMKSLKTILFVLGLPAAIQSDKTFEETARLLNGETIIT